MDHNAAGVRLVPVWATLLNTTRRKERERVTLKCWCWWCTLPEVQSHLLLESKKRRKRRRKRRVRRGYGVFVAPGFDLSAHRFFFKALVFSIFRCILIHTVPNSTYSPPLISCTSLFASARMARRGYCLSSGVECSMAAGLLRPRGGGCSRADYIDSYDYDL